MSAARSRRANDKHNHLQRTPILVMGCSLLIACCIAFGGTNWTASAQPSEDQLPEQNAIVEPGYYQETIGSYEAISQSDDDERAENLRLAAEAINGYVIEPGATFSFNEVVGDTTAERGYKEAPVLYSSGLGSSDGGGICQVSTALYIEAAQTAREDDRQTRNPKPEEQHLTLAEDELQIGLRIKVIADQAGVSEQEHRRGDEGDPHIARKVIDRHLNERHAVQPSRRLGILNHEHQHDHGRTRADEERIDID